MATLPFRVLGIGGACIDLILHVEEKLLDHIPGGKGGSQIVDFDVFSQILSLCSTKPLSVSGGSAANTIKGLSHLGIKGALFTQVGSDEFGNLFVDSLIKEEVIPLVSPSYHPTAVVLCLITPDGQRTMRFFSDSVDEMSESMLLPELFLGVELVHLEGYLLRNGSLMEKAMKLAKIAGAKVSLDLSSYEFVETYRNQILELLEKYVDIVFGNEDEANALTGLSSTEACYRLQELCSISVILRGKNGCLIGSEGQINSVPGVLARVVDTTGAGDLFASGFLYGYLNKYSLEKCGMLGNRLGAAVVEVEGANLPIQAWKSVHEMLST